MPSLWKRPYARRNRTWDHPIRSNADLGAMFFSFDAIANEEMTPASTYVEGATYPFAAAAHHRAFGPSPPLTPSSVSLRGQSKSTATARYRSEQPDLRRVPSLLQQRSEPLPDSSNSDVRYTTSSAERAAAATVTRKVESKQTIAEHSANRCIPPALEIGFGTVTESPDLRLSSTRVSTETSSLPPGVIDRPSRRSVRRRLASSMASLNPSSAYRLTGQRSATQVQAKEQQIIIEQKLSRANQSRPPYDFMDLIGKGTFGRVYLG